MLPGTIRSFFALYVQTPAESTERIPLATQRHLLNHFKLVTELGGEVIQVSSSDIMGEIIKTCRQRGITTVCMGHPAFKMPGALFSLFPNIENFATLFSRNGHRFDYTCIKK